MRQSAIRALGLVRHKSSVAPLVQRMAKEEGELVREIDQLPSNVKFKIIAFAIDVNPWKPNLQQANVLVKFAAQDWVKGLHAIGGASKQDLAWNGLPGAAGTYVDPDDVLREVRRRNELRKVVIHTIGIGEFDASFRKRLAEQNGPGQFVDLGR